MRNSLLCAIIFLIFDSACYAQSQTKEDEDLLYAEDEILVEGRGAANHGDKLGRSFYINENDIKRTAQTGVIEDIMVSIKQLPGVGYSGTFDARPSIRGSNPEDFPAVFNGFYIEYPFHWDGTLSIFDPRVLESVTLSHGVFSARYGKTCAGLLQVSSKKPDKNNFLSELSLSTSAADALLNIPFDRRGGFLAAGRVSYLDAYVGLAKLFTDAVDFVQTAPYIRNMLLDADYEFSPNIYYSACAFLGNDGLKFSLDGMKIALDSLQGFFVNNVQITPLSWVAIDISAGSGFYNSFLEGDNSMSGIMSGGAASPVARQTKTASFQLNTSADFALGTGVIISCGIEEQLLFWGMNNKVSLKSATNTSGVWTSPFVLSEWRSKKDRIKVEAGLRLDHLLFFEDALDMKDGINTPLAFNPRLNFDIVILQDLLFIDSLSATLGTGLFSSLPRNVASYSVDVTFAQKSDGALDLRQTSSHTSIGGLNLSFLKKYSFTLEGYYKNAEHQWYQDHGYRFDGKASIWGIDLMFRKFEGRYFDGWVSYSFNYAKNKNGENDFWYFPDYHRFHTLNININFKLPNGSNLSTHFSYASGRYKNKNSEKNNEDRMKSASSLDLKFSKVFYNLGGKSHGEFYVAVENLLSIFENPEDAMEGLEVNFQLPIPIPSFGFKISY